MTTYLNLGDLLQLAEDLHVGPVRDLGLLASAVARPQTQLYGREAYTTIWLKAAVLLESIVRNHALVDGNKRLGFLSTTVFLHLNGLWMETPDQDAYDLVIDIAQGTIDASEAATQIKVWSTSMDLDNLT